MTKTIDNLQLNIKNLHCRLESNNPAFSTDLFSMGFTLQELQLSTTDTEWNPTFLDRTTADQSKQPLFKLLKISNLGFYYKPNEFVFISVFGDDN